MDMETLKNRVAESFARTIEPLVNRHANHIWDKKLLPLIIKQEEFLKQRLTKAGASAELIVAAAEMNSAHIAEALMDEADKADEGKWKPTFEGMVFATLSEKALAHARA